MSTQQNPKPCKAPACPACPERAANPRRLHLFVDLDPNAPELSGAQLANLETVLSDAVAQEIARSLRFAPKVEFLA